MNFKTIFQGKKQSVNYLSLSALRYDFMSETETTGNLTKYKQAKVQIIAGYLFILFGSKLSPMGHYHNNDMSIN